jgi:sporulation protein YlmC with PRC-barrel domain
MDRMIARPVKRLLDQEILDCDGKHLGEMTDMVVHLPTGRIAYVVLSFGGSFMGWNNKLFAVPWEVLSVEAEETGHEGHHDRRFVLNASKEQLEKAPGFDRDHWPDVEDFGWVEPVYSYYQIRPFWL